MDDESVLDLNDFFYFVQVVDRGGFTAAGRMLRIPKSTLSHRIQQLEIELGDLLSAEPGANLNQFEGAQVGDAATLLPLAARRQRD